MFLLEGSRERGFAVTPATLFDIRNCHLIFGGRVKLWHSPSPLQGGRRIADFSKRKNKFEISGRTFRRVLSDGSTQTADEFSVSWRLLLNDFGVLSGDSAQEADFSLDLDESFATHSGNPYCLVQCGQRNR